MSNANTGPGTRVSGRRTTHKPGEFANLAKGKGRGGSADDKGKGAGVDEDGDSVMLRGAPAKVGLRLAGNKPLLAVIVWVGGGDDGGAQSARERRGRPRGTQLMLDTWCAEGASKKTVRHYDLGSPRKIPRQTTERCDTLASAELSF